MNIGISRRLMGALGAALALTLAAGAIFLAGEGTAQTQPQNRDRGVEATSPGSPRDARGGPAGRRSYRLERRLDYLHERLEIRPSQDDAWRNFAASLQQEVMARRERFRDAYLDSERRLAPPTAVEALEGRLNILTGMRESLDRVLGAMRQLYAALDDDQKRAADELFFRAGIMDRMGGRGPGPRGGFFDRQAPGPYDGFYR
jgi:LTXXQ motif family protein